MPAPTRLDNLREQLQLSGVDYWSLKSTVIPTWWHEDFAEEQSGFRQLCTWIARALDLNLKLLLAEGRIEFNPMPQPLYKKPATKTHQDVEIASRAAAAAARLAMRGLKQEFKSPPESGLNLRTQLSPTEEGLRLKDILEFCWESGIPVLPVPDLPGKKMDALAVSCDGRPAIVISKHEKFRSRLCFIIAHELGHIARRHTETYSVIPDEKVRRDSVEQLEKEANAFALELLFGHPDPQYKTNFKPYPETLSSACLKVGRERHVDPAAIINNWSYHEHKRRIANGLDKKAAALVHGIATSALRRGIDEEDGEQVLKEFVTRYLATEHIPKDALDLLNRLTGLPPAA